MVELDSKLIFIFIVSLFFFNMVLTIQTGEDISVQTMPQLLQYTIIVHLTHWSLNIQRRFTWALLKVIVVNDSSLPEPRTMHRI